MTTGSGLLQMLGLGAARPASPDRAGATPPGMGGIDFAALLQQAQKGELSSGLPVTPARGVEVELTPDQLQRVAAATDRAEAQGATRALVLIDGIALKVDVSVRQVLGKVDVSSGQVLTGIDAIVTAPVTGPASASEGAPLPLPRAGAAQMHPSLLKALSQRTAAAS
jgi:hypothetical protein